MKKRITAIIVVLVMVLSMGMMTGCGNTEKAEVTVLAAASLTDAMDEIIAEYEKNADVTITVSYAGSGDLVQQIQGGAPCDIFVSASKGNMDTLEGEGYIDTETRKDLLTNTLTLIAAKEKANAVSMDALTSNKISMIAIGEPETVPAGKYASQVFENMGITTEALKEVVRFIFENTEIERLNGRADVRNIASNKVMEKCGFVKEGTVRQGKMVSVYCDYNIYGMLRADYMGLQGINS